MVVIGIVWVGGMDRDAEVVLVWLGALPDPSSGGIVIDLAVTCDSAPSVGTHGINQGKENEGVIGDRLVSPARVNLQGIERISVSLTRITIG